MGYIYQQTFRTVHVALVLLQYFSRSKCRLFVSKDTTVSWLVSSYSFRIRLARLPNFTADGRYFKLQLTIVMIIATNILPYLQIPTAKYYISFQYIYVWTCIYNWKPIPIFSLHCNSALEQLFFICKKISYFFYCINIREIKVMDSVAKINWNCST